LPRSIPYLPGVIPKNAGLLARFLPPLPEGLAYAWLSKHLAPGSWVLDPFGASPRQAVEAAWAGYRVLVAANNPVARSLLEWSANPPSEGDLKSALAELAAAHKGDERIEPHIKSLYITECSHCGQPVMADYFLWERQAAAPFARVYHCPNCGDSGERPATPADATRAAQFSSSGLHRARALERVAALTDPDRQHVEEALSVYLPRAVYALFTLINKLDGISLPPARRSYLQALLLNACDQGNTLWAYPTERERPRLLSTPHRFRENNIWLALEQGLHLWDSDATRVPLVFWPELPPVEGGICLFEGRLRDLAQSGMAEKIGQVGALLAALPRPNQAFWTLSALWAGWLWGREAVGPFKSVLRRRRYDWAWHTAALSSALSSLESNLQPGTPFWGLIGEAEPGFLSAAAVAAAEAGFDLDGICLRGEPVQAQLTWRRGKQPGDERTPAEAARQCAAQGALGYLQERNEPADYLYVHGAALAALADEHKLMVVSRAEDSPRGQEGVPEPTSAGHFTGLQSALKDALTYRAGFRRYEGSDQSLDVGSWWLREPPGAGIPLADRVEVALVRFIQGHPGCSLLELDNALCEAFPGLLTPDLELIQVCLESYGEQQPANSGRWSLRAADLPAARRFDLDTARGMIVRLGDQLGFVQSTPEDGQAYPGKPASQMPYAWLDRSGEIHFIFYILGSATLGEVILQKGAPSSPEAARVIVLPGSRANLAAYKLQHDPHLAQEAENGWRIVKYRHLRHLAESPFLTPEIFREQLGLDPITYTAPQMRLL
jgi:hypothetical protein